MLLFYVPLIFVFCAVIFTVQFFQLNSIYSFYIIPLFAFLSVPLPSFLVYLKLKESSCELSERNDSVLRQIDSEGRLLNHSTARDIDESMLVKKFSFLSAYLQQDFVPRMISGDKPIIAVRRNHESEIEILLTKAVLASYSQEDVVIESVAAAVLIDEVASGFGYSMGYFEASISTYHLVRRIEAIFGLSTECLSFELECVDHLLEFDDSSVDHKI